ncbi:MAG: hypothetical protein Fur0046_23490 [Cyanobacteria bacterium J069]
MLSNGLLSNEFYRGRSPDSGYGAWAIADLSQVLQLIATTDPATDHVRQHKLVALLAVGADIFAALVSQVAQRPKAQPNKLFV